MHTHTHTNLHIKKSYSNQMMHDQKLLIFSLLDISEFAATNHSIQSMFTTLAGILMVFAIGVSITDTKHVLNIPEILDDRTATELMENPKHICS